VTGYVSSKEIGYRRITKMKRMGSEKGGRIFLFRGTDAEEQKAIDFLQNQHVIVRNVPKKICKKSDMKRPQKWDKIDKALVSLKENHLFRTMKTIESAQSSHVTIDGKDYVLMASNNYLDIASHPSIKSAVVESTAMYGFGSGGSRLTTGNTVIHNALENKIASYKETEAAIVFNTGYVANVATISAMVKKGDTVFSDELNHASIIDGCRLSKAKIVTYAHNDMDDLRKKIQENPCETGIVVSDAVFSMDGDILKLPEFLDICEENQLFSMVDEAHSTGVIGKTGHGIREYWQEKRQVDILMGTFSKSIGGEGGYVAGETRLINYLRNVARGFIFSTSLSPVTMAANLAGIEVLEKEISRVTKLQYNVKYFCRQLGKYGINVKSETAIIPVIIGDEENALTVSNYLHENGYFISAIRYPTVAKGAARLRVALMSSHTEAELKKCAELIGKALLMK
jgi:8-amino-7-oxononanoate synthase